MLDIVVSCSISETGGVSLIEAMAARKPIISTDSGGPAEFLIDGVNGLVVPVKESRAVAQKIEYLIDHPSRARSLAENAEKASKKYDIRSTTQKIEKLYEEVFLEP
jgi:glycosyltransferase involved in cell wall biosynthesis